jgi:hypothetical protein
MKEFEPSPDFVNRVMKAVLVESATRTDSLHFGMVVTSVFLRWSLVLGGILVTLLNLFRVAASIFVPSLCS